MRNLFRIYLEKPELAGVALLIVLVDLVRGALGRRVSLGATICAAFSGLLPEVGLVSIGVTILMICGEFDLSVGSTFALTPMATSLLIIAGRAGLCGDPARPSASPPRSASSTASSR